MTSWRDRAPYRPLSEEESHRFEEPFYRGHCHCHKVRFDVSRQRPLASKICHCGSCQTLHGAPFQWAAIFHKEDVHFSHGHEFLAWYHAPEHQPQGKLPAKVSCKNCRTPLMDQGRRMLLLFPTVLDLEASKMGRDQALDDLKPTLHMFYPRRVMDVPDGLPKHVGLDDSETCPEH